MLLLAIVGNVSAQEVVYDFTGTDWKAENGTLSNGTVSITGEGSGSFKMNSGYFMLGKSGAYITLPAYDFAVEKIEVVGRSGASGSCKQNIFVGETAVSTETTGVTGSNIYEIASDYQDAGTQYTIKVTSAHNSQITAIKIYKVGGTVVEPLSQITIAEARAQQTGEVLTAGIVTSVNGKTAYIQDNTAAIVVYGDNNLNVGDAIKVQGTLTDYHGLLEISSNPTITVISQGNTVEPVVTAIADISNDNQAKLIKIENATVTAISDQNVTIAQGESTIVVRFNNTNDIKFDDGNVISLTGNIGCYNNPQIANPREIDIQGQKKFYLMGINDDWAKGIEFEYKGNGVYTLALTEELEANVTFKFKDSDGKWYFSESNGNYEINADNHSNIALQEANTMDNYYINIAGTWTFTITESENGTSLTVDGDWPRKRYYFIGQGKSDTSALEEMVFNEETGVYEYEYTPRAASDEAPAYWFAISDVASFTDWDDFNANHRYSAQEGDYTLTESNSKNVQLTKANGAMMFYNVGTYKLTLTEDLKLTVTGWPKELPEGNAFVKVTSIDDLTNGYYLIVYEGNDSHASVAFNGGLETLDAVSNTIDVTIGGDKIVATNDNKAAMFYIDNNAGTLQSESGFYIGKTAYGNGLDSSDETQYTNTFSIDENGNAVITASGNCTLRYNYASDQARFRYYKSGQQAIALYKLTTVEPVEVTLNKYGYATLYYGDMSLTVPEGVTATTYDEDVKESITYAAGDVIPAGEAVVLKGKANAELSFELGEATVEPDPNNALMGLDEAGETVAPADGDYKFYMLSAKSGKVGFYFGTGCPNGEAFQTAAHKAYLVVPVAAGAKECYIFGETTGINSIQNAEFAEGSVYNLNGQRVDKSYKGVVIVNGKKLIKK